MYSGQNTSAFNQRFRQSRRITIWGSNVRYLWLILSSCFEAHKLFAVFLKSTPATLTLEIGSRITKSSSAKCKFLSNFRSIPLSRVAHLLLLKLFIPVFSFLRSENLSADASTLPQMNKIYRNYMLRVLRLWNQRFQVSARNYHAVDFCFEKHADL